MTRYRVSLVDGRVFEVVADSARTDGTFLHFERRGEPGEARLAGPWVTVSQIRLFNLAEVVAVSECRGPDSTASGHVGTVLWPPRPRP